MRTDIAGLTLENSDCRRVLYTGKDMQLVLMARSFPQVRHNMNKTGETALKLYTIYAPPEHAEGTLRTTKADAEAREEQRTDRRLMGFGGSERPLSSSAAGPDHDARAAWQTVRE